MKIFYKVAVVVVIVCFITYNPTEVAAKTEPTGLIRCIKMLPIKKTKAGTCIAWWASEKYAEYEAIKLIECLYQGGKIRDCLEESQKEPHANNFRQSKNTEPVL